MRASAPARLRLQPTGWGSAAISAVLLLAALGCTSPKHGTASSPEGMGGTDGADQRDAGLDSGGGGGAGGSHAHDAGFGFPDFGVDAGKVGLPMRTPPTKIADGWACRPDFALDLVCDCGCGGVDLACPTSSNISGCADPGCTVPACEACFGIDGKRITCGEPGTWMCETARIGDGKCDCGCGDLDPDCMGGGCFDWGCNVEGCDVCLTSAGTFGECSKPAKWTCGEPARSDGKCDCGCGNLDPDCVARSCSAPSCHAEACEVCHDANGDITDCRAPETSWKCDTAERSDAICDCGCGVVDTACKAKGCSGHDCDASACQRCHDEFGRDVPCKDHYTCDPRSYDDGDLCDCGCGSADPDCKAKGCSGVGCKADACEVNHDAKGKAIVPSGWSCDAAKYGAADGCDCGCGAIDPDCHTSVGACSAPGCAADRCDACYLANGDTRSCHFTCELSHWHDGICDCGCGDRDPDCGDGLGCEEPGCYQDACGNCFGSDGKQAASCVRGNCAASVFNDGVCDCGCREMDPDCRTQLSSCAEPGCSDANCGRCHDDTGTQIVCSDWYCDYEKQGNGGLCNCGCGAIDPDCGGGGCSGPGCNTPECDTCRTATREGMSCNQ